MNKEQKMWTIITIVTVSVLVLIFAGITYAFFTTSDNEGSTAEIISDSGKMIITYGDGTNTLVVAENISPSNNIIADKTFSVTGTNTTDGLEMPFSVNLEYQNTFENGELMFFLKRIDNSENVVVNIMDPSGEGAIPQELIDMVGLPQELLGYYANSIYDIDYDNDVRENPDGTYIKLGEKVYSQEIINGYFKPNSKNETITFNLRMMFRDIKENQDYNKGATFNGKIVITTPTPEPTASQTLAKLYATSSKDSNGITLDGLQKDGTGSVNVPSFVSNNSNKKYNVSFLGKTDNLIADTEYDEYDNLRYVGANPNNYILFNEELWRIVGIFNNITTIDDNDGSEKSENLIKIVRNESLGNYSWDTSDESVNSGNGINEWSQAKLMTELNTDYLDTSKTSGTTYWYDAEKNSKSREYNYSNNIKSGWDSIIATVRWNTGGVTRKLNEEYLISALDTYKQERGSNTITNPADKVSRTTTLDGKIALMYQSDYRYASTENNCRGEMDSSSTYCKNTNWMFTNYNGIRFLSPSTTDASSTTIVVKDPFGNAALISEQVASTSLIYRVGYSYEIVPTLYLKSDIYIIDGNGTSDNPYQISPQLEN